MTVVVVVASAVDTDLAIAFGGVSGHRLFLGQSSFGLPSLVFGFFRNACRGRNRIRCVTTHSLFVKSVQFQPISVLHPHPPRDNQTIQVRILVVVLQLEGEDTH